MGRATSDAGLLPDKFEDFRSVEFWDGFFDARGNTPFEWYGDWKQLRPFVGKICTPAKEVLVVGCGNSELSADLYDSGCERITNVDFSRKVIASMMGKNLRKRPNMKWKVADMTALKIPDGSFDVVLDKGGLDALMGEESPESAAAGVEMLAEASRVLRAGGCYACVTLAQSHVLRLLLDSCRGGWAVEINAVPPSPDMARSPLQPVFVAATKTPGAGRSIDSSIRPLPAAPNSEQLAEICRIAGEAQEADAGCQSNGIVADFSSLHPGRSVSLDLPAPSAKKGQPPKYMATIVDVDGTAVEAAVRDCCVFIVPQGRESEWLFASADGQAQVAAQCASRRVIFVALGRGHAHGTADAVRAELSPLVRPLAPVAAAGGDAPAVPLMTTQDGVGARRVLETAESSISGRITVEDVALSENGGTKLVRRMVFVSNQSLIQSEAVLRADSRDAAAPAAAGKRSSKSRKRAAKQTGVDFKGSSPDLDVLAMDYHAHVIGGICSSGCLGVPCGDQRCLVVGLGGGGLAVFLHRRLGLAVEAVELDAAVVALAESHFGFRPGPGLRATVGDGLEAVAAHGRCSPASLDVLIVDAGSGDARLAMSCPPPAFLEAGFLRDARAALKPSGALVVNCVTRLDSAFASAMASLQGVFKYVYTSDVEDDVNRVLFALNTSIPVIPAASLDAFDRRAGSTEKQTDLKQVLGQFSGLTLC